MAGSRLVGAGSLAFPVPPLSLSLLPLAVPNSQLSALLRTNQRLYFTNVTLSRRQGGPWDNEGERERRGTDRQKWIIRTESFTEASDTAAGNKDIKFHCKVFFNCSAPLFNWKCDSGSGCRRMSRQVSAHHIFHLLNKL